MAIVRMLIVFLTLAAVALHAPGQWSVDSVVALGESVDGRAVDPGSTFFAAVLAWLGGGEGAAALLVALVAFAWSALLIGMTREHRPLRRTDAWRVAVIVLIVANPMLWLYAGIVWKDVLLGTSAALTVWLFDEGLQDRRVLWRWWVPAILVLGTLPLIRQQGVLLAVVIGAVFGARLLYRASYVVKAVAVGSLLVGTMIVSAFWSVQANRTVTPPERSPFSAERVDSAGRNPQVAHWIQQRSAESVRELSWSAAREEPAAYVARRLHAAGSLLGFSSMQGCVSGYWGVAGPPEVLARLEVSEAMDPRDRWLGRVTQWVSGTPFLRHWFYLGVCVSSLVVLMWRRRWTDAPAWAATLAALVYSGSYIPMATACEFRHLYPSAALSMIACLWLVMDGLGGGSRSEDTTSCVT